ncbi:MAG: hypothetical protein OQJ91_06260 [Motiliproteus sp.]|nr:hypothetical protein [Motiliproteus sp.]
MILYIRRFFRFPALLPLLAVITLSGCGGKGFNVKNIAKSDVDMVADTHVAELNAHCRKLMIKLYKRNPKELAKIHGTTLESRLQQLTSDRTEFSFPELNHLQGNNALRLAFDEDFTGDRVFALMVGLRSMLHASYNQKIEFFLLDDLDQQKLYNSARNLEIIAWRLNNHRSADGSLYLLSNGYQQGIANLSFERLFGKMISLQDMMSKIVSGKTDRAVNTVIHGVASTTLLPIGI